MDNFLYNETNYGKLPYKPYNEYVLWLKLFIPSGLYNHNHLDWSISNRKGVLLISIFAKFYRNSCISSRKHAYIILTPLNPTFV